MNPALANLLADETALKPVLHPDIYVEPKDKGTATEAQRQGLFLSRLKICAPAVFCFAVPNGGRRTPWEKFHHKALGMVAGFPDMCCLWEPDPFFGRGIYFAEWKDAHGDLTPQQIDVLNHLHKLGFRAGVYRTADCLLRHLQEAGAPVRLREGRLREGRL